MVENITIKIDEEVWKMLKELAEPFEDTPNTVLRRVFNLPVGKHQKPPTTVSYKRIDQAERRRRTNGLSVKDCYVPLLLTLEKHGGRMDTDPACKIVTEMVKDIIKPPDHDLVGAAQVPKYRNKVQWARKHLVIDGLMKDDSPHGVWEISEEGRKYLQLKDLI